MFEQGERGRQISCRLPDCLDAIEQAPEAPLQSEQLIAGRAVEPIAECTNQPTPRLPVGSNVVPLTAPNGTEGRESVLFAFIEAAVFRFEHGNYGGDLWEELFED